MRLNRLLESPYRFPSPFGCRFKDAANENGPDWFASDGARLEADMLLARQCARSLRAAHASRDDKAHIELCSLWAAFLVSAHGDTGRLSWVLHECFVALSSPPPATDAS